MCLMDTIHATATQPSAFADRMFAILNDAALAMMISIGHRTALFDTLSRTGPVTSRVLATEAGLEERYVREWLGAMVSGRILMLDAARQTYALPPEHAAFLTRAATPNNLAVAAQFVSVLGGVEDRIVECFNRGGGVPYSDFKRFHAVMAEESNQTIVSGLVESVLPVVPGLVERLRQGIRVLDVGCGSGRALNRMAEAFPTSHFVGYDLCPDTIATAQAEQRRRGLANVRFEVRDVAKMHESAAYDLVTTFDAIHDQAHPQRVLDNIRRALAPDGVYLAQDISGRGSHAADLEHPFAPFLYTISCMHCMTVSLAYGGDGLGAMWGRPLAIEMLTKAGFADVQVRSLEHDPMNDYFVARAAAPRT